ncbi:MAG: LapA family protein [Candidimonas sp.]|nr:MAG: LapA family protein [Candidimonas sp.]
MRLLAWILRLIVFVLVLMFAMNNTASVDVNFYAGHAIAGVPLIVVMLVMFIIGVVLGLLVTLPAVLRRRREARKLRRDLARLQEQVRHAAAVIPSDAVTPEAMAPLAPL